MELLTRLSQRWSMDFVSDQLASGHRFRVLNIIVDDHSRELVGQLVAVSITGVQVSRLLHQIGETRQLPKKIVCDNKPIKFTCKAMFFWSQERQVELAIHPAWKTNPTCICGKSQR